MSRRIVIASNNEHKVIELREMLATAPYGPVRKLGVVGLRELASQYGPAPTIAETSNVFVGNALLKANGIAAWLRSKGAPSGDLVLADDSGICIEVLDGLPGVDSAYFAGPTASDADNNRKLISELEARGVTSSPAEYVCMLVVRYVGTQPFEFTLPEVGEVYMRDECLCIEGRCSGEVRIEARGSGGFGYDPHFWIDRGQRTFAELSRGEKSRRSHRGVAMRRLFDELPLMIE